MSNEIKILKNSSERDWDDIEWIEEFYRFLQGELPEGIHIGRGHKVKLSEKKAFAIIWYLQEHFSILPDHIERCDTCGELFDDWNEGIYWETKGKNYCYDCQHLVPENYDRGRR